MALPTQFTPKCPGCGKHMSLTEGKTLHYMEKHLHKDMFYYCTCGSYQIKCFPGTLKPMGRPGDATLRDEQRWCQAKLDEMVKAKMRRDRCVEEAARAAAWKWVSKTVKKEVERVEELGVPEMGLLVPVLRKF